MPCGNNSQSWRGAIPSHDSPLPTGCFGLLCGDCGRDGEEPCSLPNQTPSCAGTGPGSGCIGTGTRANVSVWDGNPRVKSCAISSSARSRRTPHGGAPRIHGELKMLGFDISERTVLRWMRKAPRDPAPARRWAAFLNNHSEAISAMDFFTVPTLTFGVLYCFFVIAHDRRRILQCNVTRHPTSAWVAQQLREAFPSDSAPRYLIFDREHTFHGEVLRP